MEAERLSRDRKISFLGLTEFDAPAVSGEPGGITFDKIERVFAFERALHNRGFPADARVQKDLRAFLERGQLLRCIAVIWR